MSTRVVLLNTPAERHEGLPVVTLLWYELDGLTPPTSPGTLTLTLLECDHPDEKPGTAASSSQELAELAIDLEPNPAPPPAPGVSATAAAAAPAWRVTKARLVKAWDKREGGAYGPKYDADRPKRLAAADLVLRLGDALHLPLVVPIADGAKRHEEGRWLELGLRLKAPVHERTAWGQVTSVPYDSLRAARALHTVALGPLAKRPEYTVDLEDDARKRADVMGRFNGPGRVPRVDPLRASDDLDDAIEAALKDTTKTAVDVDGLAFDRLFPAARRAELIHLLHGAITLTPGDVKASPLRETDLNKAYFVIHDIGGGVSAPTKPANATLATEASVSGYVNHDGTYAAAVDLDQDKHGTLGLSPVVARWAWGWSMGFELVPIVREKVDAKGTYAQIGVAATYKDTGKRVIKDGKEVPVLLPVDPGYFHWTQALVKTVANLYLLASARANHLLTMTFHMEVDRNVMASRMAHELDKDTLQRTYENGGEKLRSTMDNPGNVHGDPYGLDPWTLYDAITARIDELAVGGFALAGRAKPTKQRARYGTRPDRVVTSDPTGYPRNQVNGSTHLTVFPHQSAPPPFWPLVVQKGHHKGWWKAAAAKPAAP